MDMTTRTAPVTAAVVARYLTPKALMLAASQAVARNPAAAKIATSAASGSQAAARKVAKMALAGEIEVSLNAMPVAEKGTDIAGIAYHIEYGRLVVYPPADGCPTVYPADALRVAV